MGKCYADFLIDAQFFDAPLKLVVEVKRSAFPRDVREAIWQLKKYIAAMPPGNARVLPLLMADTISPGARALLRSTVAWIRLWTRQAYPLHFSCNALELGPAKFCHPVKNTCANLCFSLLIGKMSRFHFGPDHIDPSRSQRDCPCCSRWISAMPSVLWSGFLQYGDRGQMEPAPIEGCNGSLGRWDNDLHDLTKACRQKISGLAFHHRRRRQ